MKKLKIKYFAFYLTLVFITLLSLNSSAQDIEANAELDTSDALIGDQVGLGVKLIQPKDVNVQFPVIENQLTDDIEVIEQFKIDTTELENEFLQLEKRILISAFDSGHFAIPSIAFLYNGDTIKTNPLVFNVNTVPVDTADVIKDIKGPYEAPISFAEILPWALGGIGLILLILIIIYIIRKIKRNEPIIRRFKPIEPAHVIAYRELNKLKNSKLWQKEQIKEYYTELTDILRKYLWNRYAIKTLERTSDEILQSLKMSDFDNEDAYLMLKEIFYISDLVKFAKFKPLPDEHKKCYDHALRFVDLTKLIIEENNDPDNQGDNNIKTAQEVKNTKPLNN